MTKKLIVPRHWNVRELNGIDYGDPGDITIIPKVSGGFDVIESTYAEHATVLDMEAMKSAQEAICKKRLSQMEQSAGQMKTSYSLKIRLLAFIPAFLLYLTSIFFSSGRKKVISTGVKSLHNSVCDILSGYEK